jgi:predicted thioesterase
MSYRTQVHIEPGAQARDDRTVTEADTARSLGTGEVPVLASSRVIAWFEEASLRALEPHVPAGSTSVAMRVQMDHIRAASVGCRVTTIATLERIEGRRYVFVASAISESGDELARGRVVRVVVEVEPFLARACGHAQ